MTNVDNMRIVAITGGIGSGKSVVSRLLRNMGFAVYDCDSRAKAIMASVPVVRQQLIAQFGEQLFVGNQFNPKTLASQVFSDSSLLQKLNSIVHPAVREDLVAWARTQKGEVCFVETAILHGSGLDKVVNATWCVTAPEQVRVERVARRSGLTEAQISGRIKAQQAEETTTRCDLLIVNDGISPVLPQVMRGITILPCR